MDKAKLKEKFENVYRSRIEPCLIPLEQERIEVRNKFIKYIIIMAIVLFAMYLILAIIPFLAHYKEFLIFGGFVLSICLILSKTITPFRKKIKGIILSSILGVFGKFFIAEKAVISFEDMEKYKLFPLATTMTNDDILIGRYNDLNICIQECVLSHSTKSGKTSKTIKDFSGILVKINMNKRFEGLTIVRGDNVSGQPPKNLKRVYLEDPEFEKLYNVFSNDQIEARYLLTTAFMERIKNVREIFAYKACGESFPASVCCVFDKGHIILAISTFENFFEVGNIGDTMMKKEIYEKVFYQMVSIFDLIYALKLEQKLGM